MTVLDSIFSRSPEEVRKDRLDMLHRLRKDLRSDLLRKRAFGQCWSRDARLIRLYGMLRTRHVIRSLTHLLETTS